MSSPHLLILLLYLSVQPCNGRHLLLMDSSNYLSHHPRKVDQVEPRKYSLERPQSFNLVPAVNKDIMHEIQGYVAAERLIKGPKTPSKDINRRREMEPGVTQIQSHETDPLLHVPHEKHEEHLEFNIDYDQPKAHPPSHN